LRVIWRMEAKPPSRLLVATAIVVVLSSLTYALAGGFALNATRAGVDGLIRFMVQDKPEPEARRVAAEWRVAIPPADQPAAVVPAAAADEVRAPSVVANRPNDPVSPARREQIRAAQVALARLGFYNGQIDGSLGKGTSGAIRAFEKSLGWPATGQLTPKVAAQLTPQAAEAPQT
jgi:hypothetical protein